MEEVLINSPPPPSQIVLQFQLLSLLITEKNISVSV